MKQNTSTASNVFEPMKTLRVWDASGRDWDYEMKFDGYRALAFKAGKEVRLFHETK